MPTPEEGIAKLIELFGGADKLFDAMEASIRQFDAIWEQDADAIGRVLRAHLAVEYFLTAYIQARNPNLGSLDNARLTFAQKIELLGENNQMDQLLKPGLRRLNQIRNRLSHRLQHVVDDADKGAFLGNEVFAAARKEGAIRFGATENDPLSILEQFARFAAGLLQAGTSPHRDLWAKALDAADDEEESPPG